MYHIHHSLFAILLLLLLSCSSQKEISEKKENTSTIYLVRHAEKMDDSKDPDLSKEGKDRAQNLAGVLKDRNIKAVYSTDYKRTRQTAMPVSEMNRLTTEIYNPKDNSVIIGKLKNLKGGNALIVGHSNSTPALVNQILGMEKYKSLDHEEYDKLFVLECDESFNCIGRVETY